MIHIVVVDHDLSKPLDAGGTARRMCDEVELPPEAEELVITWADFVRLMAEKTGSIMGDASREFEEVAAIVNAHLGSDEEVCSVCLIEAEEQE